MELDIRHTSTVIYARLPDGSKAYIKYKVSNGVMEIISTYTPLKYRGRGVAKKLMEYAISLAMKKGLLIKPVCSYSIYYFIKHPEKRDILAPGIKELDLKKVYEERLREERGKVS